VKLYFGTANGPQRSGYGQIGSAEGLKFSSIPPSVLRKAVDYRQYPMKMPEM
jgi:hypothetical protein